METVDLEQHALVRKTHPATQFFSGSVSESVSFQLPAGAVYEYVKAAEKRTSILTICNYFDSDTDTDLDRLHDVPTIDFDGALGGITRAIACSHCIFA